MGYLAVPVLAFLLCHGYTNAGYGAPVGLVSKAASSSYSGQPAAISRAAASNDNGGYVASSNSGGYDNSQDNSGQYDADSNSGDNGDYSQSNSGSVVNSAQVASNAGSYSGGADSNVRIVPLNSGTGSVSVDLPYAGADAGVRVMTLNTNSVGDIGNQIQVTIQNLLRKFGIQMQRSAGVSFQPGQTYVVRGNGVPVRYAGPGAAELSQYQYQSNGGQGQYQRGGQSQYQGGQPISVAYKVIGHPGQTNSGLAVRVASQGGDGIYGGVQSSSGSGVLSGASASSYNVPNGRVSYSGVQPVVTYSDNSGSDADSYSGADVQQAQQSRGNAAYASAGNNGYVQPANNGYAQQADYSNDDGQNRGVVQNFVPAAAPVRRQKVKFAASSSKKTEKNSQVAFESESEA